VRLVLIIGALWSGFVLLFWAFIAGATRRDEDVPSRGSGNLDAMFGSDKPWKK
jgi:hypothetical protein